MKRPSGLVLHEEELFVADTDDCRIQVFHQSTGRFLRQWGRRAYGDDAFVLPVVLTAQGEELFVADVYKNDIQVYNISDSRFLGAGMAGIEEAVMMVKNFHFALWASVQSEMKSSLCEAHSRIFVLSIANGKLLRSITLIDTGRGDEDEYVYNGPSKLCVDQNQLLFADKDHDCIQVLNLTTGEYLQQYDIGLRSPSSMAVHGDEVIICDQGNGRLVVFDRHTCKLKRRFGSTGSEKGQFGCPYDLAMSAKNELFVLDTFNNRIVVLE